MNLSPFTKDFRGEDQHDEYMLIFTWPCFGRAAYDECKLEMPQLQRTSAQDSKICRLGT